MYQHDPELDDLLRRPMQMANQEEFADDEYDDDDEDDMFGADLLAAAQEEREEEEREAAEFAASLMGEEPEPEPTPEEAAAAEAPPEPVKLFTRPGIRRNLIGYGVLTLFGLLPLVLLFLFGVSIGLSPLMGFFAFAMLVGLGVSVYNLVYSFQHGYEFTVSFNIRSFFKLWPELTVISVVLVALSFWNLSQLDSGKALTLSGKQLASAAEPQIQSSLMHDAVENEEVIYSSFKKSRAAVKPQRAARYRAAAPYRKAAYRKPLAHKQTAKPTVGKKAAVGAAAAHGKAAVTQAAPAAAAVAVTAAGAAHAATNHDQALAAPAAHGESHTTEAAATTTAPNAANAIKNLNASGGAIGIVGSQMDLADRANKLLGQSSMGAAVGAIGAMAAQLDGVALPPRVKKPNVLSSDNPTINTYFLGGALCAAFGYALILGLAGAIFGGLRKFETPFSQKYVEIINIETGEVTSDVRPVAPIMQPINIAARVLIGLFYGSTLGFALGVAAIVPLFLFFKNSLGNPLAPSAMLLQSIGLASSPDLAFSNAVTLGGIMIPLVMLIVAKMSPQGMSISEELMRQHYEIKPTGRFLSADQVAAGMGNPAAINFGEMMIPDDVLETELATNRLVNEMSLDDDNLTSEIIEEFGREFETVFGIDTRELISQPRAKQTVDRKRLASALDESFGELGNVPVEISAELGQASLPITEWLNLREGTLVLLDKSANEEIDILFNGVRKGKGKLVVSDNALSVKVSTTNFQDTQGNGKLV